jgi:para-nitrobenzyl esterase
MAQKGSAADLAGTSWQLLAIRPKEGPTVAPDDSSKYTLDFGAGGKLSARIDCNRGSGHWTSSSPGRIEFGPMALTRAMCPPGSLHDRVAKDLGHVRAFAFEGSHLVLTLEPEGTRYEFDRAAGNGP